MTTDIAIRDLEITRVDILLEELALLEKRYEALKADHMNLVKSMRRYGKERGYIAYQQKTIWELEKQWELADAQVSRLILEVRTIQEKYILQSEQLDIMKKDKETSNLTGE